MGGQGRPRSLAGGVRRRELAAAVPTATLVVKVE